MMKKLEKKFSQLYASLVRQWRDADTFEEYLRVLVKATPGGKVRPENAIRSDGRLLLPSELSSLVEGCLRGLVKRNTLHSSISLFLVAEMERKDEKKILFGEEMKNGEDGEREEENNDEEEALCKVRRFLLYDKEGDMNDSSDASQLPLSVFFREHSLKPIRSVREILRRASFNQFGSPSTAATT